MCKDQCSSNCLNALDCDHVTGACNGGCLAGWTGPRCDRSEYNVQKSIKLKHNVLKISHTLLSTFNCHRKNKYDLNWIEHFISIF